MATKQDYEFRDVIPEDCLCIICMDVLQEPQLTDCCGQHFCKACLEKSLQTTASHREAKTGGLGAGSQGIGGGLFQIGQTTANHREAQTGGLGAGSQGMGGEFFSSQTTASHREAQTGGLQAGRQVLGGYNPPIGTSTKFEGQIGTPTAVLHAEWLGRSAQAGESRVSKQCPHCRTNNFKYMINLPLERKINNLKVHCPNKGCEQIVRLGDVKSHKQGCDFLSVKCTNSCGKAIMKKDLQFHCQNKCSKRKVSCQHCGQSGTHEAITSQTHTSSCPEVPLRCDNLCGALKMKRKNMSQHKQICPEATVSCMFAEAGCTVTTKRKDLDSHVTANVQQHLSLLMTAYMTIKQELQSLKPLASTKFRAAHNHF